VFSAFEIYNPVCCFSKISGQLLLQINSSIPNGLFETRAATQLGSSAAVPFRWSGRCRQDVGSKTSRVTSHENWFDCSVGCRLSTIDSRSTAVDRCLHHDLYRFQRCFPILVFSIKLLLLVRLSSNPRIRGFFQRS